MKVRRTNCAERDAAISNGHRFYLPKKPCWQGHLVERYAASGACMECERSRYEAVSGSKRKTANQSVYVLSAGPAVKIGIAASIRARLQVTQAHCPYPVAVVFCSDPVPHLQAKQVESRVCRKFSHTCLHGSWFSANAGDVIAAIQAELTDPFA